MKFLTIGIVKDIFYTLPQAEQKKLMVPALRWGIDLKKKMGAKFLFYAIPGWDRTVSISEFNSLEEYSQSLQSPLTTAGFANFESYPLIELDEKTLQDYIDSMK